MTFTESTLSFTFLAEQGELIAYDRHRYYNAVKGSGLRGVDFLGIWKENTLVLLEVKNFRLREAAQSGPAILALLEQPDLVFTAMVEKKTDSLKGLDVIEALLRKRRLYRLLEPFFGKLPPRWQRSFPWAFWAKVWACRSNLRTVLWLETDPEYDGWEKSRVSQFRQELRKKLRAHYIELAGNGENPFEGSLLVE
ncbi:MAG: hypothetical protein H6563_00775 [Lewinellaceae bacterium]|nr:hypothetical protein [Lewinellaceae bacterium]